MAVVMKKVAKTVIALTTKSSAPHTAALAASIGIRCGTASSEERMAPLVYSLLMTITPSTQMASWPRPRPAPKITAVGSASNLAWLGWLPGEFQVFEMTIAISAENPMATTTKAASDQTVDRTDRIFVHSEWISRKPGGSPLA